MAIVALSSREKKNVGIFVSQAASLGTTFSRWLPVIAPCFYIEESRSLHNH
jgi:hypothetical protein